MKANKKLGQNFLIDEKVLEKINALFSVEKEDMILEIGSGMGALTKYLVKKGCPVVAYEIDRRMQPYLDKLPNLKVYYQDFLGCDLSSVLNSHALYVVANIPYYITTPIIEHVLKYIIPDKMILLVQREVAERFCATPNSRNYGYFTVYLRHYFNIMKAFDVSPTAFLPIPKVNSAVVILEKKKDIENVLEKQFFEFVKQAFGQKRKILKNNLKEYWPIIAPILEEKGYSLNVRAEELSYEMFLVLYFAVFGNNIS